MDNVDGMGSANVKMVVPVPSAGKFFRSWLEVLKSQHHLTDRETDLLAAFVERRYQLQRTILDPNMVDALLMSTRSKREIRESVNISPAYYQRIMLKYKRRGIIIPDPNIKGGKINPRYIPALTTEDKTIGILFIFINPNDG